MAQIFKTIVPHVKVEAVEACLWDGTCTTSTREPLTMGYGPDSIAICMLKAMAIVEVLM